MSSAALIFAVLWKITTEVIFMGIMPAAAIVGVWALCVFASRKLRLR